MELWTFGSKPVLGKELLKESFLIWYYSDMGRSRKCYKFYEKNYSVVIHTPNVKAYVLKRAFRDLSTVWEAGAWFLATLILHLSSWIRCEAVAKVGNAPATLTTCHNKMSRLWAALSSLIYIHRQISALQCGKWKNLLLPRLKKRVSSPNLWIVHTSLVSEKILCARWWTSRN